MNSAIILEGHEDGEGAVLIRIDSDPIMWSLGSWIPSIKLVETNGQIIEKG